MGHIIYAVLIIAYGLGLIIYLIYVLNKKK
jgi:hypothetical protein